MNRIADFIIERVPVGIVWLFIVVCTIFIWYLIIKLGMYIIN